MKQLRFLAFSLCIFALSACDTMDGIMSDLGDIEMPTLSSDSEPESEQFVVSASCPNAKVVEELGTINEFMDISDLADYNLVSSVEITGLESSCTYSDTSMTVDLKLAFEGNLGPRARQQSGDTPFFSYPFFVAVTSPRGDILAKEIFAASMTYESGQNRQNYYESLRQIIPVDSRSDGARHKVLVGFQLSQDQLAYNRAQNPANAADSEENVVIVDETQSDQGPIDIMAPVE